MSRQQKLIQLPLLSIAALLCLVIGLYLFACKRFAQSDAADTIVQHPLDTQSDDVLKYWTADTMHGTKGAELPIVDNLTPEKQGQRYRSM